MCRKKAKPELELNFTKVTRTKRRASTGVSARKERSKKAFTPLISKAGKMVTRMRRRLRCPKIFCLKNGRFSSPHLLSEWAVKCG